MNYYAILSLSPWDFIDPTYIRSSIAARSQQVLTKSQSGVATIPVFGALEKNPTIASALYGGTSYYDIAERISSAVNDPSIGSILLRIDSPGGSVDGLADVGDLIYQNRNNKPFVAQIEGTCASAAYYLASQCTAIYANRMDTIGSIGSYAVIMDMSKAAEQAGIKPVVISSAELKTAGFPGTQITKMQQTEIQRMIDTYAGDFYNVINRTRPTVPIDEVKSAKMYFADEAIQLSLIDGIQNTSTTIAQLKGSRLQNEKAKYLTRI